MIRMGWHLTVLILTIVNVCLSSTALRPALAQDLFFKGKQLHLVVGSDAGGGFDAYARLLARHLGDHIPGQPSIVVQNMPGASSLNAMNYIANIAPPDGTYFGAMQGSVAYEPMMGISGGLGNARFDPLKVNWIGSLRKEVAVATLWNPTSIASFADLKTTTVSVGSSGASTANSIYARLMNTMFGTKFRIVEGYISQVAIFLAMQNGEVQGSVGPFYSALTDTRPDWLREKKVKLVVQLGLEKDSGLPDVPLLFDFAQTQAEKQALILAFQGLLMAHPFVLSQNVTQDRVALYRKAFKEMIDDRAFVEDANNLHFQISAIDGETLDHLVAEMYATPRPIIEAVTASFVPSAK